MHTELDDLYAMIDTEIYNSDTLSHECDDALSCKQQELLDTLENIKINGTINSMRLCQIEVLLVGSAVCVLCMYVCGNVCRCVMKVLFGYKEN